MTDPKNNLSAYKKTMTERWLQMNQNLPLPDKEDISKDC